MNDDENINKILNECIEIYKKEYLEIYNSAGAGAAAADSEENLFKQNEMVEFQTILEILVYYGLHDDINYAYTDDEESNNNNKERKLDNTNVQYILLLINDIHQMLYSTQLYKVKPQTVNVEKMIPKDSFFEIEPKPDIYSARFVLAIITIIKNFTNEEMLQIIRKQTLKIQFKNAVDLYMKCEFLKFNTDF